MRTGGQLLVVLIVGSVVAVAPVAALAIGHGGPEQVETVTANESVAPGERFAGVVGVEAAEFEGELEARSFGQRVAAAASNESAAAVVGDQVDALETELADIDREIGELQRGHENESLSEGQYRARLAKLLARQRALQRQINQTEYVAEALPAEALEAEGVNVTAIRTLQSQASEMTGPEVAAVARSIAGKNAGKGMGGPPDDAGPPAFVQNRTGGPPADAGPGSETGPPEDPGPDTETGAPADANPENETGPPEDSGTGNETGPPEDSGTGNETGAPGDSAGDGAGENGTDGGDAGNGTDGGDAGNGADEDGSGQGNGSDDDGDADSGTSRSALSLADWR